MRNKMAKVSKKPKYRGVYSRIDKKGNKTFYINYRVSGKFIWEKIGTEAEGYTAAYALKQRVQRVQDAHDNNLVGFKMTLNHAFDRYMESLRIARSRYKKFEEFRYNKHIRPVLGQLYLKDINLDKLERLKGKIMETCQETTAWMILGMIKRIYKRVIDLGLYRGANPVVMKELNWTETKRKRSRYLSNDQVDDLLETLKGLDEVTYRQAAFAAWAGLRKNEIFQITPAHVDFENKQLVGIKTKSKNRNTVRSVKLSPELEEILSEMVLENPDKAEDEPFFRGKFNYDAFYYACDKVGLNDGVDPNDRVNRICLHSLRHAFASNAIIGKVDIKTVQYLLGHKNLTSTMVYLNPSDQSAQDAQEALYEQRRKRRLERAQELRKAAGLKVLQGGKA